MDKKKIIIVSVFIAILILVPFNAVGRLQMSSYEEPADDLTLVKESEPELELPENIDAQRIDISKYDLTDFEQRERDAKKLIAAVEDYIGQDIPMVNVPVFVNGVKVKEVSTIDIDELEKISGLSNMVLCLPYLAAAILWLLAGMPARSAWAFDTFLACIGGSLIGGVLVSTQPQKVSDCSCDQMEMDVALR